MPRTRSGSVSKAIKSKAGLLLDIGCGEFKQAGWVGMDHQEIPGVDIVHDLEVFPWPLPDESCHRIKGGHIIEHIKPWLTIPFFNECWRVMRPDGQALYSTPYAGSPRYWQDPTHCNGFNEVTFWYFDPKHPSGFYNYYKPKPWSIEPGFPVYQMKGDLEIVMRKAVPDVKKAAK
jgi:SAM-dependent methyltransferase